MLVDLVKCIARIAALAGQQNSECCEVVGARRREAAEPASLAMSRFVAGVLPYIRKMKSILNMSNSGLLPELGASIHILFKLPCIANWRLMSMRAPRPAL